MAEPLNPFQFVTTASRMAIDALREGRLPLSPRRWLIDLKQLYGVMTDSRASGATTEVPMVGGKDGAQASVKQMISELYTLELWAFLRTRARLRFDAVDAPKVSVLLVLYNRAELTLRCLRALREQDSSIPLEVVIVDNNSTDDTPALLDRLDGVRIIRPGENLGFLKACNLAARAARGEHLLFLNNDAEVLPGTLAALVHSLEESPAVGAVGGRLVLPDGRLQEAGSIIWRDGSCLGYGRHDSPWAAPYSYKRDVDYCSAALLLTPRALFLELGLFDERLQPAYYEDSDFCVRVWKAGKRVVYDPRAIALHFEFASSKSAAAAIQMQIERRSIFVSSHRDWLNGQSVPIVERPVLAREKRRGGLRILLVDDQVPHASSGFGFPRANELVRSLVELGHFVTLLPTAGGAMQTWEQVYADIPETVEVMNGYPARQIPEFFKERDGYYDCVLVSRPHNMQLLRSKLGSPRTWMRDARIVYDGEAIAAERELERRRLAGETISPEAARQLVDEEVALAHDVDAVLTVSSSEEHHFTSRGITNVHVVSHKIPVTPTPKSFDERSGLLFVGAFNPLSPNADSVLWFAKEILPRVRELVGGDVPLLVAGHNPPKEVTALAGDDVRVLGSVADLAPLYDAARVFVAPTRYAAGIPFKVGHAAAHGLPVVATSLLARQLEWVHDRQLLAADTVEQFAVACASLYTDRQVWQRIRQGALEQIRDEYSVARFNAGLAAALSAAPAVATESVLAAS